jgi:hypothetical protein
MVDQLSKEGNFKAYNIYFHSNSLPNPAKTMTIFLPNHSHIQLIEDRLQQNQYFSNECLPNFVDAQVFIALKTSNRNFYPILDIPKR